MHPAADHEVDLAAGHLTALITRHLPDLLLSLNLVGSAVDGDFRPGRSDLDFVAVLRHTPTDDQLEGIGILHRLYAGDPTLPVLDGIWITDDDLRAGPDAAAPGPATQSGVFHIEARGNRNPVTWVTLREHGRTVLGELDRSDIWNDRARLIDWTRANVEDYWVRWHEQSAQLLSRRGLAMLGSAAPTWGVLGISRMHATSATGAVLSKSQAAERALEVFDARWHPILNEALRIRRRAPGPALASPWQRRQQALDYMAMVIEAIRRLEPDRQARD